MRLAPQMSLSPATSRKPPSADRVELGAAPAMVSLWPQWRCTTSVQAHRWKPRPRPTSPRTTVAAAARTPLLGCRSRQAGSLWLAHHSGQASPAAMHLAASTIPSGKMAKRSRGSVGPVNHVPGPATAGRTSWTSQNPSQSRPKGERMMPMMPAAANAAARIDVPASSRIAPTDQPGQRTLASSATNVTTARLAGNTTAIPGQDVSAALPASQYWLHRKSMRLATKVFARAAAPRPRPPAFRKPVGTLHTPS